MLGKQPTSCTVISLLWWYTVYLNKMCSVGRYVRWTVCLSVTAAGWQQGVNLLAAVSVLITTDVCCKRMAAGNKDTMVSAAVPWCDSIRQEDAYWQGEKGGRTERDRVREREQSVVESVTLALTQCHESPHHYSSDHTGPLFKLKHLPGAECQKKGSHQHTRQKLNGQF